jgi:hypothetical protein
MWGRSSSNRPTGMTPWGKAPIQKPTSAVDNNATRNAYFDWEKESKDEPNVDMLDIVMKIEKGKI